MLGWLYDKVLEERKKAWDEDKRNLSCSDQRSRLPELRKAEPAMLGSAYAEAIEATLARVDKAFKAFFRRCRTGEKPVYPRSKPASTFRTIECLRPPRRWRRGGGYVPRIKVLPQIKIKPQRGLPSLEPQFVRITRTDAGIKVNLELHGVRKLPLPPSASAAGIDPGVADQVATSDGERIRGVDDTEHRKATRERSRAAARSKKGRRTRKKRVRALGTCPSATPAIASPRDRSGSTAPSWARIWPSRP